MVMVVAAAEQQHRQQARPAEYQECEQQGGA
jgi:hypothetical protein